MEYCSKCGREVPNDAEICMGCGCRVGVETKSPIKSKKGIWIGILVAVLAVIIIGVVVGGSGNSPDDTSPDITNNVVSSELEVSGVEMTKEYNDFMEGWDVTITGKAKNVSRNNYSYASVEFSVYDKDGNNLGSALANMNNLASGETWVFEATWFEYSSSEPNSCKLADVVTW